MRVCGDVFRFHLGEGLPQHQRTCTLECLSTVQTFEMALKTLDSVENGEIFELPDEWVKIETVKVCLSHPFRVPTNMFPDVLPMQRSNDQM